MVDSVGQELGVILGLDVENGMPEAYAMIMVARLDEGARNLRAGRRGMHLPKAVGSGVENDALEVGAQASLEARMILSTADEDCSMNVGMIETCSGLEMGRSAGELEPGAGSGIEVCDPAIEPHGDLEMCAEDCYYHSFP